MDKPKACSAIPWLAMAILIILAPAVYAQDLFTEMDKVKQDISQLKAQVQQLSTLVYDMRRMLLGSSIGSEQKKGEPSPPGENTAAAKQEPTVSEEQLTKIICEAVGNFFSEAEAVLRSTDVPSANSRMNNVLKKLNTALEPYSGTHRVSKLMGIYEGLAWDTYTAVQLRDSVTGNEDFLKALQLHKQKYLTTCPKR